MCAPDVSVRVVDIDWGCALVRPGAQQLFHAGAGADPLTWEFYRQHRDELLNVISVQEFLAEHRMRSSSEVRAALPPACDAAPSPARADELAGH